MPYSPRLELLGFDPYRPRQDTLRTVAVAQPFDMIYAVEQRDHDSIAQFFRRDGGKGLLERCRLYGDPDDIVRLIEPIGDSHRRLEGPERLTFDGQPLRVLVPAAGPHE
jgi:hypothetical protein